ncbi:MAG: helix-turn-helix domain-containing protein [Rhodopirellula sp.]|nr:helix-turn-helix domain-containing protein [Rhodopirellula sp.]
MPDNESKLESVESQLISVDVLASMIDLSPRTVWRMVSARTVPPPIRLGRSVRWRKSDIETWIAGGCPEQTTRKIEG